MVIGRGLVAQAFKSYAAIENVIIFASGVSDSKSVEEDEFLRERLLVAETLREHPNKFLVYFSTCSIYDPSLKNSRYVQHKLEIEKYIQQSSNAYLIFRVSNVVGEQSNIKTVFGFFIDKINTGAIFDLWKYAERNIIDVEDMAEIVHSFIENGYKNSIINVANLYSENVVSIVEELQRYFSKNANFVLVEKGSTFDIDTALVREILPNTSVTFEKNYIEKVLKKYYPNHEL